MVYTPTNWQNQPSTATPLSAANLNKLEQGIVQADITNTSSASYAALAPAITTVVEGSEAVGDAIEQVVARDVIGESLITNAIKLPTNVRSEWLGYNSTTPATRGNFEYVTYIRDDLHPVIAQRDLTSGVWVTTDISSIFGNVEPDGHNYFRVEVDGAGYIHVWGNMHAVAMKYAKSVAPNSIASFAAATMVGTNEDSSTYPDPVPLPNGDLLFLYRNGVSGEGDVFLNRYSVSSGTWSRVGKIFDGTTSGEGVYTSQLILGTDGILRLGYNFRGTGSADTNNDVCYVQSTDFGVTWKSITGTTIATPISHATSPVILDTAATGSGLVNSVSVSVTDDGTPHLAFLLFDANAKTNVYHMWHNGSAWQGEFVTFGTVRMALDGGGVISSVVGRPSIASSRGNTFVLWRTNSDGKQGTVRAIDVTTPGKPFEFSIANLDIGFGEISYVNADAQASGILKVVLTPQPLGGSAGSPATNWQSQWGVLLKLDLTRLRLLGSTQAGRPGFRNVGSFALPTDITILNTSYANVAGLPPIFADASWSAGIVTAQLSGRFTQAAGTSSWGVRQQDHTGSNGSFRGETPGLVSGTNLSGFRWPATLNGLTMPSGGWLTIQAKTTDTTAGSKETILKLSLEQMFNGDGAPVR